MIRGRRVPDVGACWVVSVLVCEYAFKHKELLATIRAVHAGKKSMSPEVSFQLAEHATDDGLTPTEVRVLRLIAEGNANKEIAAQLSTSEDTVKGQVRNILSKLGAKDRTHAAMIGLKRGIIEF